MLPYVWLPDNSGSCARWFFLLHCAFLDFSTLIPSQLAIWLQVTGAMTIWWLVVQTGFLSAEPCARPHQALDLLGPDKCPRQDSRCTCSSPLLTHLSLLCITPLCISCGIVSVSAPLVGAPLPRGLTLLCN